MTSQLDDILKEVEHNYGSFKLEGTYADWVAFITRAYEAGFKEGSVYAAKILGTE